MQGCGVQLPTPAWPVWSSWPGSSQLKLVLHVSCRHLGRFPDKGSFHRVSGQDSPGELCKAVPAGAHQPCREEAAPTISPAPLTKQPLPCASTTVEVSTCSESYLSACPTPEPLFPLGSLSPWPLALSPSPQGPPRERACPLPPAPCSAPKPSGSMMSLTQGDSTSLALGTIRHRSSPHSPWRPAVSGLDHSNSPGSALAWWQEAAKAWSFSTLTHLESQKESRPLYPPEASFWGQPRNRQVEAGSLAFINPDVQELLGKLITRRVELKFWKEKEKEEEADYHLTSLGNRIESLGHKQHTLGHQHFWNIKGKYEQLLGSEKPRHPDTLRDCLQKTCSQLFWGLPFLHSESLVAAVTVPGSALELCPVLFNERSEAKPFHTPAKVTSQLSLAKHSTHRVAQAQPQSLTPTMPQLQPSPLGHMETQDQPLPLAPVMPQCQPSSEVSIETQSSTQILPSTMPHSHPPTRAHTEIQARPQLLAPTMPHFQPPPLTHMEPQARPPRWTPGMPQIQPPPRAHTETQARPQLLAQTMAHFQPPPRAHTETQARPQLVAQTIPHFQPPLRAHMENQARPQLVAQTMPHFQPPLRADMKTQVPPLLQTPPTSQCQPPQPQAHMDIQDQSLPWTPNVPQFQPPVRTHMETQARSLPWTSTMPQCPPPSEVSMEIQDHQQPSTPTMPQFQPPPRTHIDTQVQSQLLAQTLPHIQAPLQDHMETQVPPLLWTPSMSQCQPPQPQAHMETQVQHLSWTPNMPQFQPPVRAHMETQAQSLPWGGRGQATMPQCPPPSKMSMQVPDHHQPSTPTMPQFQPPPRAHMEIQAQPIPLSLNIPHCQPSSWAHMEIQAQPESLTPNIPRYHPRPQAQLETTVHPSPSRLVQSSSSQHQIGSVETSCPTVQNKPSSCSSNAVEQLEYHFWKKQLERERILPSSVKNSQQVFSQVTPNLPQETRSSQAHSSVSILPGCLISPEVREKLEHHISNRFMQQQTGLPYRIQASQKLMQPQDQYPRPCQAQGRQWRSRSSAGLGKRRHDAQKMRSKCPAQIQPGRDLRRDIGQSVGKIVKDLYMVSANPPVKDPRATPESERVLSPDKKHPEVSRVLTERKAEEICERESPVNFYHSRLADNLVLNILGETNAPMKTESTQSSQDGKASMITSRESLVLGPYTEQELEAHIIRFQVRHRWSLLFKVLKFIFCLKLKKVQRPCLKATCESGDHSTALLTKGLGKHPQSHAGEKLITTEAVAPLESALPVPVPSRATENTRGHLGGPTPGDTHKPSEVPLTGQENKPCSQAPKYNFVSRMWHSESVVETEKGSLEPSPSPATARNEPQKETRGQASPESSSNVIVVDLDEWSPSSRAQEVVEGDSAGKGTREPSVQVKPLDINMDLRRSWSPRSNKSPSLNTKSVASNTEDLLFETQFLKRESQGFTDQQDQAQGRATSVLLQDCETGVLLQDCATDTLLKDCHSNMFLAANILASQESLSYSQILSSRDKSNSQKLCHASSSEGSSQGHQVDMRRQLKYKRQGKKSAPKDGREKYTGPKLRQIKKGLAERRAYQAQGMSHPGQKKESTESPRSQFRQVILKKRHVPSESHFKERIRLLLQWIFPKKCRQPEETLQKGKPEIATVQSQESIKSKSTIDSRAIEAQTLMTAVGQILKKMVFHHGPYATEVNWYQAEFQDPIGPHYCQHRILSYQEQRRMRRDTPHYHQAIPMGRSFSNKSKWTSPRDSKWAFSPREPGPPPGRACPHGSRLTSVPGHPLHCPRHGLLQKYTSSGESEHAFHSIPRRKTLHQEKNACHADKYILLSR
ncbi:spermatogenesis-associated protein 31A6-like isoform X2 [Moschus berezovskii]|uniref:spermatogenesis-associated protein 31A6-like isoform X2 n=1 Tax=Moschus berezovskii TaxID=68408 RepID=UPI002444F469|nr:spermatogenesis-associated protein 31A6-like isoform X2 [Moschus berezovskii]